MSFGLTAANCGACDGEKTLVPVNLSDLSDEDAEDWVIDWKCSACGTKTSL